MKQLLLAVVIGGMLVGCNDESVSGATAEEQRTIARDNSKMIAQAFVRDNPQFNEFKIIPNGDSTISRKCPQGDGWASLKLINDDNQIIKIKCSTHSRGIGCMTAKEFNTKTYKQQDGNCDSELDYPLPKVSI